MQKFLTDVHTHSSFSFDGEDKLSDILARAYEKGLAFYGVSEHFNYDMCEEYLQEYYQGIDEDAYFHTGRHLQEDYAGCMNVLIGAEFGFAKDASAQRRYAEVAEKYQPDFIVNSVHAYGGWDYYTQKPYYNGKTLREKTEVYAEYFRLVLESLDAQYPYDIVGHLGYCARYAPYEDKTIVFADLQKEIDAVLLKIIQKDKILEVNSSTLDGSLCVPSEGIVRRYFDLGGRKISFASDTHGKKRVADKREAVVEMLKNIGFTYITVPCKGEHIKVEI